MECDVSKLWTQSQGSSALRVRGGEREEQNYILDVRSAAVFLAPGVGCRVPGLVSIQPGQVGAGCVDLWAAWNTCDWGCAVIDVMDVSPARQVEIARVELERLYEVSRSCGLRDHERVQRSIRAWRRVLSYARVQAARESGQHISRCMQLWASIPQV